ncbi:hypothetical protein DJ72_08450 [Halorubrum distributum]|nr:hypothetical protein DJ72_08450 [Halorubrum distributum]
MSDDHAVPAHPDELDFTDDENVVEIGEGRYAVGTNVAATSFDTIRWRVVSPFAWSVASIP